MELIFCVKDNDIYSAIAQHQVFHLASSLKKTHGHFYFTWLFKRMENTFGFILVEKHSRVISFGF